LKLLVIEECRELGAQPLIQLMASAVQGCLLKVHVRDCMSAPEEQEACIIERAALVLERGSRNIPCLKIISVMMTP
jgi:hypothetical protein